MFRGAGGRCSRQALPARSSVGQQQQRSAGAHLVQAHARLARPRFGARLRRQVHARLLRLLALALLHEQTWTQSGSEVARSGLSEHSVPLRAHRLVAS